MGIEIEQFPFPVCNSFKAKILNDQLCYEVDLNVFKDAKNGEYDLKSGLVFFMDYNEDREALFVKNHKVSKGTSWLDKMEGSNYENNGIIYLNTISE